jgi:hypothetical protein
MKSRAVIKLVPLGQTGGKPGKTGPAQEIFEANDLVFSAPHAGCQKVAHKCGHAQARLGGLYAQPFGNLLAHGDGDVFHNTNIV